jgi:hypothetical protein
VSARAIPAALVLLLAGAPAAAGQRSVRGGIQIGLGDHRVVDNGTLVASSGTLFGAAVDVTLGPRYELHGEASGGHLTAGPAASLDDHDLADAQLLAGMRVRPWLSLQTALGFRGYSNALARQHWTTWRIGAEARVPLGFETVGALLRGYWIPVVSVSGFPKPDAALAAAVGLEWRGRRLGVGAWYSFERYDFPLQSGTRRLEEVATLRVGASLHRP